MTEQLCAVNRIMSNYATLSSAVQGYRVHRLKSCGASMKSHSRVSSKSSLIYGALLSDDCCRPVHGLIFLYKWRSEEEPQGSVVRDSRLDDIFFAKQVSR